MCHPLVIFIFDLNDVFCQFFLNCPDSCFVFRAILFRCVQWIRRVVKVFGTWIYQDYQFWGDVDFGCPKIRSGDHLLDSIFWEITSLFQLGYDIFTSHFVDVNVLKCFEEIQTFHHTVMNGFLCFLLGLRQAHRDALALEGKPHSEWLDFFCSFYHLF